MNKKIFNIIILAILISAAATGFFIWNDLTARPEFSESPAKRADIEGKISLLGRVESEREAGLGFEINGRIAKIYHTAGDQVSEGDVLAVLADDDLKAQYSQAVSLARSAEGVLENYQDLKDKEKYKLKALKKADAASNDKKAQEEQVDAQDSLISSQEDQVKAAWANVQMRKAQLEKATIRASFAGVIAQKNFEEGEVVAAGTPVVTLINDQAFEIEADSSEIDISKIRVGMDGAAKVSENPERSYPIRVVEVDEVATQDAKGGRAYKVKLEMTGDTEGLRSGMETRVELIAGARKNVLTVPTDSVFREGNDEYVYVVSGGKQEKRKVKTGVYGGFLVEIVSGLSENENILVLNSK